MENLLNLFQNKHYNEEHGNLFQNLRNYKLNTINNNYHTDFQRIKNTLILKY